MDFNHLFNDCKLIKLTFNGKKSFLTQLIGAQDLQ